MSDRLRGAIGCLVPSRKIQDVQELPRGAQGASGSEIRYYVASFTDGSQCQFITKNATLLERRVLSLLSNKQLAVPPLVISDLTSGERSVVVQPYADPKPEHSGPFHPLTRAYAKALAAIHAAHLKTEFAWVPKGTEDNLYLVPWRTAWQRNLEVPVFVEEFGRHTSRLETSFNRFMTDLESLERELQWQTLINADLHPDHMRMIEGSPCFIDWEQARIGPFYLDLVNYFRKETALVYRDELAALGHTIPVVDFLDRFHSMGRYMGFRYLEVGLDAWYQCHQGKEAPTGYYESQRWFLYYCLELALNGR